MRSTVLLLFCALLCLAGCSRLPALVERPASQAAQDTAGTTALGRGIAPQAGAHPGLSGVFLLDQGRDAFAARILLADAAERTLDLQYYIWRDDVSGRLLLDALRRAADRGVRVRLLLDDHGTGGLDALLAAVDAHPQIEVRLFNPYAQRRFKLLGFLTEAARLNRRMHNKTFTADNQATVVGGRNVGDEYFGAEVDTSFIDLDVLAVGPVVQDVSRDFDRYWASISAYPLAAVLGQGVEPLALPPATEPHAAATGPQPARDYLQAVEQSRFVADLLARRLQLQWAPVQLLSDDPAKVLSQAAEADLLWTHIVKLFADARRDVHLVSPYFVPGERGTAALAALAQRGVQVSVLTNALEATDVAAVHAGCARRRKPLLQAGVALFETRRSAVAPAGKNANASGDGFSLVGSGGASSGESLHAKTFVIDRQRLFVGSFNFDPRSALLNTELGFVIDDQTLASAVAERFEQDAPTRAYHVTLNAQGDLQWQGLNDGKTQVLHQEPGASFWRRATVRVLSWLPIESFL